LPVNLIEKRKESFCILGYLLKGIKKKNGQFEKKNSSKSGEFGVIFFPIIKNPLYRGRNHIFQVEIWRKLASKRKRCCWELGHTAYELVSSAAAAAGGFMFRICT
jgi:hypothetical protein